MRAVRVTEFGSPDVLRLEEVADPAPSSSQLLIKVEVAGVGYGDTIVRSGRYPFPTPYVPGLEVGGEVVQVGSDGDPTLLGVRVVATTPARSGGYAELAVAEAADTYRVPAGLPLDHAVAVFQAGAIAVGLLSVLRPLPGESVLITAATGRIGSLLVQHARSAGAGLVIGAVGSAAKAAAAREVGVDIVVDYSRPDWAVAVKDATHGRGTDITLDAIGGDIGAQALDATADGGGRFGLYGFTSGDWVRLDAHEIGRRGITVIGALGIVFAESCEDQRDHVETALRAAAADSLVPRIHGTYTLSCAADAHHAVESRDRIGAVLIKP